MTAKELLQFKEQGEETRFSACTGKSILPIMRDYMSFWLRFQTMLPSLSYHSKNIQLVNAIYLEMTIPDKPLIRIKSIEKTITTYGQRENPICLYPLRTGLAQMGGQMPVMRTMEYLRGTSST